MTEAEATIHAARNILDELKRFVREAWIAFTGSRAAWIGVIAALLPAGAYALSLALQSNLAVELGLDDDGIAQLNVVCTLINAVFCILGGWLSDRFGRRSTLALFVALTIVPTLWLAYVMWKAGWIMPVDIDQPNRPHPSTVLVYTFWAACIVYNVFQGLYYGIRTALYMDITTPAVAATQFTAYMAMLNLCISYTSWWQGFAVERIGYPSTLVVDSVVGLFTLLLLPLMRPSSRPRVASTPALA
jgi:MFS family permease